MSIFSFFKYLLVHFSFITLLLVFLASFRILLTLPILETDFYN